MKIVFLSRYQYKLARGAEVFVSKLSLELSKNHEIHILSGKESDSFGKIISGNYDVVISINGRTQSLKASIGRIFTSYKLVISGQSGIGRDDILNIALARPDIFVALTDSMVSWAKKWAWGSKVVKIPNGVDLSIFKPQGPKLALDLPRPVILSVGALVWYKHHERVIEAAGQMDGGSLLIVGDGEDRSRLQSQGEKLLKDRFKIAHFTHEEMAEVYRSADLFTLPSWDREGFGIAYVEAMASGLPVVAPDDPVRREIVGEAGIFTDVSDSQKYAQAINQCLKKDWKDIPRKQAAKFSWDKIAKQYEEVIMDMFKGN